jgi:DNA-binding response OmpR family regulator
MKAHVLIIDDQVKVYASLARNFKHFGYQTFHAKTGQEALELLAKHQTHVVLLDIMLGEENGVDISGKSCMAMKTRR